MKFWNKLGILALYLMVTFTVQAAQAKVKVYDCFPFFNELEILDIRLHELNDVVDKFILIEATNTHQGKPKRLFFEENKERYQQFLHKIEHVVVTLPQDAGIWVREEYQRDYLSTVLARLGCKNDDIVLVSDADEINRASVIRNISKRLSKKTPILILKQSCYNYYLNGDVNKTQCANSPYGAKWRYLKQHSPSWIRINRLHLGIPIVENAGWHFSWIGQEDKLLEKIQAYAHPAGKDSIYSTKEGWKKEIQDLKAIGGGVVDIRPVDSSFPQYVQDNVERFIDIKFVLPWEGME